MAGLAVPLSATDEGASGYSALELFVKTAQTQGSNFTPANELPAIVEICQHLQGLPLGILLAASATRNYTCRQLADGLKNSLDLVSANLRNLPPRHRSLRGEGAARYGLRAR